MADAVQVAWNRRVTEGESPVVAPSTMAVDCLQESGCLGMQPKMGGKLHLKLNTGTRPIANKYREGKMKSTLKRELKVRETVKRETNGISNAPEFRCDVGRGAVADPMDCPAARCHVAALLAGASTTVGAATRPRVGGHFGWCYSLRSKSEVTEVAVRALRAGPSGRV